MMFSIFETDSHIITVEFLVIARAFWGHRDYKYCDGQDQKNDQNLFYWVFYDFF